MPAEIKDLIDSVYNNSYSARIEEKREQSIKYLTERKESEIKALESKKEYVPMPEEIKKRMEDFKNEIDWFWLDKQIRI